MKVILSVICYSMPYSLLAEGMLESQGAVFSAVTSSLCMHSTTCRAERQQHIDLKLAGALTTQDNKPGNALVTLHFKPEWETAALRL